MPANETELFIALVAAVGTNVAMVENELETQLAAYDFTSHTLRLSKFLAELRNVDLGDNVPLDERLWQGMTAGDELRSEWQRGDALALAAISDIVATRAEQAPPIAETTEDETPANLDRTAFIIRSLKTPAELRTLRAVYGPRLMVIAAYSPEPQRVKQLAEEIRKSRKNEDPKSWSYSPETLIARDMKEELEGGQDVSDTFHRADFFIRGTDETDTRCDVGRALEIIFGHPYRTPTRDEHAQFLAAGEARRSSEPGRQVGAVISQTDGAIVSLGTNEVPIAGGGSFREDGPGPDNREFAVSAIETNRQQQTELATTISERLASTFATSLEERGIDPVIRATIERDLATQLPAQLLRAGLKEITEYGRAVHAEMDALLDAARRGIGVDGCTAHTSTFPCHNCARQLVAAGVRRIVFIEPYPKSKAADLHEDSIVLDAVDPDDPRVSFEPFVGLAPRRYLDYFSATSREELAAQPRKGDDGTIRRFDKRNAIPHFTDLVPEDLRPLLPAYRQRELIALKHFKDLLGQGAMAYSR